MFIKDTANHVFTKDKHPFRCKVGRFPEGSKQEDVQNTTDAMVNGIPGDVQTHVDLEPMENHKCIVPGKRPNAGYIIPSALKHKVNTEIISKQITTQVR